MPRALVAGCGFVGLAVARALSGAGWAVTGCTHSAESAAELAAESFAVHACDITDRHSLSKRLDWRGLDAVIHCASSGRGGVERYREVFLEGARHLADVLRPRTLLFTSSTSVYAQTSGDWVTEESPAEPLRETGRVLRATEEFVLQYGGMVARLAGIYGPGRSVLLRKFFAGEAGIEGDGARWINQVHRDDIASALVCLIEGNLPGIFNVADDEPLSQRALYEWLARKFGRPLPPHGVIDLDRKRGWTSKRVNNAKLRGVGWRPRFPSFFAAVENDPALLMNLEL